MLTKGIVIKVAYPKLKVRIPIFESPGSNQKQIVDCSVCVDRQVLDYKKDDIVWIGFEDNAVHKPVVRGKLYQNVGEQDIKLSDFIKEGQIDITGLQNTAEHFDSYINQPKELTSNIEKKVADMQGEIDNITPVQIRDLRN